MTMIHWDEGEARVTAFQTARRANKTVVKIELEVTGPWALGDIVRQLQEASLPPAQGKNGRTGGMIEPTIETLSARIDAVEQRLRGLSPLGQKLLNSAPIEAVIRDAAAAARVTRGDILSEQRANTIARVRFAIIWTVRQVYHTSWPVLAHALNRDHTTIMHGYRRAKTLRQSDPFFADLVNMLVARARARAAQ